MSKPTYDTPVAEALIAGDCVQRVPFGEERPRVGRVVEAYLSRPDGLGHSMPLYAVEWHDADYIERGYMRNGLVKV